ncbi:MAG: hypothetical protein WCR16_01755 [Bacilli bacterium]
MNYFIPDFKVTGIGFNALNKSRDDLHKIYLSMGFKPLLDGVLTLNDSAKIRNASKNGDSLDGYVDKMVQAIDSKAKHGDHLFMDFPFAIKFAGFSKIVSYAVSQGVKVVFFIHDLDGVRFQNPLLNVIDSSALDMASCLISATPEMDVCLSENLKVSPNVRRVNYMYWDYLCPDYENNNRHGLLCFAGNLTKSPFIRKIPQVLVDQGVNLYGKGMQADYKGTFKGQFDPESLVKVLDGWFGLVWDGKSPNTCSGNFGKYLRINTSHKFGLYMATGKPVIVWRDSALSNFVVQNSLGIAVSSLSEIPQALSSLPTSAYSVMLKNVQEIRKKVISGDHLKSVILESMK